MAYQNYFLIFTIAVLGSNFVKCAEFVPVYMWGTNKMSEHVPALHKISQDSFKDTVLEYLKKDPYVIVFAERTLSPEDFAQRDRNGESAFNNLQQLKSDGNYVSYRPYVQNPVGAIKQVKPVTQISITSILSSFDVPKENIWIINLDDAKDDETRFHMLKRHDSDIVSIYKDVLKQHDNVLALYTANHTAWVAPDDFTHSKLRNLLQSGESQQSIPNFYTDTNAILYFASGVFTTNNGRQVNITNATYGVVTNPSNITVTLTVAQTKIVFSFQNDTHRYWSTTNLAVEDETNTHQLIGTKNLFAPVDFSYHCSSFNLTDQNKTVALYLEGFQIQPYIDNTTIFGDAYDCVGFTSIPIWSGLFVTAILLLIITFGLTMMMDIKTMDRFDDPKGKTITVTASE